MTEKIDRQRKELLMRNLLKSKPQANLTVIVIFIVMLFAYICMKTASHGLEAEMCSTPGGCEAYKLNGGGVAIIFYRSFWIASLALLSYGVALILEVVFLILFSTRKLISPFLAIALIVGSCILSYLVLS